MSIDHLSYWSTLFITTVIDLLVSLVILFCAYSQRITHLHIGYKIGLISIAFGLFGQSALNIPFLINRTDYMHDTLPFWILQDFGTLLILVLFFFVHDWHRRGQRMN
ncbi:hypothetical protein [Kluyvera chengduensis]|uniref:hypothetical protein n=1 Tax=Kluyvera sp. 142359 TaxID=3375726 RepID=UPI00377396D4